MIRASTLDQLEPLLALCREGKLFEVEEWIRQGRPIALPESAGANSARRNPLGIAMDRGFHSLVQVLLEAGAPQVEHRYRALDDAVSMRRPDLAELLFEHGAKAQEVSMRFVLETWEPTMVRLFLSRGACLERGRPVAWALIAKMRPALGLLKRDAATNSGLLAQAGMALRYHAHQGNPKWVALLLWAGADPFERGAYRLEDLDIEADDEEGAESEELPNAVELAVMTGKLEILKVPKMTAACRPGRQPDSRLLEYACGHDNSAVLSFLLEMGHDPRSFPDRGTRAVTRLLHSMTYEFQRFSPSSFGTPSEGIDSSRARDRMKELHVLLAHGAMWLPRNSRDIGDVRRALLKMARGFLLEFAWLLRAYGAARRCDVLELFRTPSVGRLLGDKRPEAEEMLAGIPEKLEGLAVS